MNTEERSDEIARNVMASYGVKGKKVRQAVADAAQIGLEEATDEYDRILTRQGDLLTRTVNVLKGVPPELTTWSHHDIPELAQKLVDELEAESARLSRIEERIARLRADLGSLTPHIVLGGKYPTDVYLTVAENALTDISREFEQWSNSDDKRLWSEAKKLYTGTEPWEKLPESERLLWRMKAEESEAAPGKHRFRWVYPNGRVSWTYPTLEEAFAHRPSKRGLRLQESQDDGRVWVRARFEHDHKAVQHRDGKPPWCEACGLTEGYQIPESKIGGDRG